MGLCSPCFCSAVRSREVGLVHLVPEPLVFDESKRHHYLICSFHDIQVARVYCVDCDDEVSFPLSQLDALLARLDSLDDCQIMQWLEIGHGR